MRGNNAGSVQVAQHCTCSTFSVRLARGHGSSPNQATCALWICRRHLTVSVDVSVGEELGHPLGAFTPNATTTLFYRRQMKSRCTDAQILTLSVHHNHSNYKNNDKHHKLFSTVTLASAWRSPHRLAAQERRHVMSLEKLNYFNSSVKTCWATFRCKLSPSRTSLDADARSDEAQQSIILLFLHWLFFMWSSCVTTSCLVGCERSLGDRVRSWVTRRVSVRSWWWQTDEGTE